MSVVKNIPSNEIAGKEAEIRQMCALLQKTLTSSKLTRAQKIALMDYVEKLQLAIGVLEVRSGVRTVASLNNAARNFGKKVQSSLKG